MPAQDLLRKKPVERSMQPSQNSSEAHRFRIDIGEVSGRCPRKVVG
jgi:hypothetical protein